MKVLPLRQHPSSTLASVVSKVHWLKPWTWGSGGANLRTKGYSLVEVVTVVAVIGIASGIGLVVVNKVQGDTMNIKLGEDVTQMNAAIQVYKAHGGVLPSNATPEIVLAKLKTITTAGGANRKEIMGVKDEIIDPRLQLVSPPATSGFWNWSRRYVRYVAATQRFEITDSKSGDTYLGFEVADTAGVSVEEQRRVALKQAKYSTWVWDHAQTSNSDDSSQAPQDRSGMVPATIGTVPVSPDGARKPAPPTFSPAAPVLPLYEYPLYVTVNTTENLAYLQRIVRSSTNAGQELAYATPVRIDPGATIEAYLKSTDPEFYTDSDWATSTFLPTPESLLLSASIPASYTYMELNGPMASGSPATSPASPPRIVLTNPTAKTAGHIPLDYQNSSVFRVYWTFDGSDPATSGARLSGTTFSNGYAGDNILFGLGTFGSGTGVTVKYQGVSSDPKIVQNSTVFSHVMSVSPITLATPTISPAGGDVSGPVNVTIALNTASGTIPENARIYYRTDGMDPGDNAGEPASTATLYSGPFVLNPTSLASGSVVARVYPPSSYKNWFLTSNLATSVYTLPTPFVGITGGSTIYRLEPSTGAVSVLTPSALWDMASIALDQAQNQVFYIQNSAPPIRLGRYDLTSGTHSDFGVISSGFSYTLSTPPPNLVHIGNRLYCVPTGTDDLVQIEYNSSTNTVTNVVKALDLNGNVSLGTVGDLTSDNNGTLYISRDGALGKFPITTPGTYTQTATSQSTAYQGLVMDEQGRLVGNSQTAGSELFVINPAAGTEVQLAATNPPTTFIDLGGPEPATAFPASDRIFATTGGSTNIYKLSPKFGTNTVLTTGCLFNAGPVAFDSDGGKIYYLEDSATGYHLGCCNVDGSSHVNLGQLNSGSFSYTPSSRVNNLTWISGNLYYVAPNSDDLVQIRLSGNTIASQTHVADLNGNVPYTEVGDLTVDPSGNLCYSTTGGGLDQFSLTSFTAGLEVSFPGSAFFRGLAFEGGELNGVSQINSLSVYGVVASSATTTLRSNTSPARAFNDFAGSEPTPSLPFPTKNIFAVDGSRSLYRLDPATGISSLLTSSLPFNARAVAFDSAASLVYVLEDVAASARVCRYNLAASTLLTLGGTLTGTTPKNLAFITDHLYYVAANTDDMMRIDLTTPGTAIQRTIKAVDISSGYSAGTQSLDVGDMTVDAAGWLHLSALNLGKWFKYDLNTFSGFTEIGNSAASVEAAVFDSAILYGTGGSGNTTVTSYSTVNAAVLGSSGTNPIRACTDAAGAEPSVTMPPVGELFAITGGNRNLYRFNDIDGQVITMANAAAFNPAALASDGPGGKLYYIEEIATNFRLGRTGRDGTGQISLGSLTSGANDYTPASRPDNLVFFNGALWYITPGTDDLVRITVDSTSVLNQVKVSDINGNTDPGAVGDLTVDASGTLWISLPGKLATFNLTTLSGYAERAAAGGASYRALCFDRNNFPPTDVLLGVSQNSSSTLYQVSTAGSGESAPLATSPSTVFSDFASPEPDVTLPSTGVFFAVVSNVYDDTLQYFNPVTGAFGGSFGTDPFGGTLYGQQPAWIEYGPDGNVYVAGSGIRKLSPTGTDLGVTVAPGAGGAGTLSRFTFGPDGNIYAIDDAGGRVVRYNGPAAGAGAGLPMGASPYTFISGVNGAVDINFGPDGSLYIAVGQTVKRYNATTGAYLNDAISTASFLTLVADSVISIASMDFRGNWLYVAEQLHDVVVKADVSSPATAVNPVLVATLPGAMNATTSNRPDIRNIEFYDGNGDLYVAGEQAGLSNPGGSAIFRVNVTTGAVTSHSDPGLSPPFQFGYTWPGARDILFVSGGLSAPPSAPPVYAVGGGTTKIYSINVLNGSVTTLNPFSDAPFPLQTLAYDPAAQAFYFTEATADNIVRLGKWTPGDDTYTILGDCRNGTYAYNPVAVPGSLSFFAGDLYYVATGTDDLVKIHLDQTATSILSMVKVADIASNAAIGDVTDLTIRPSDGRLYLTATDPSGGAANRVYGYDLADLTSFQTVPASAAPFQGIGFSSGTLYGGESSPGTRLYSLNQTTGAATLVSDSSPQTQWLDFAVPEPSVSLPDTTSYYAVTGGNRWIYQFNPDTGQVTTLNGTAQTPFNPAAIACDASLGRIYYIQESVSAYHLGRYDIESRTNKDLGDMTLGGFSYVLTTRPDNLVFFNQSLYLVAPGTDDLVRLDINDNGIVNQVKIADLNANAATGAVGDLTVGAGGLLYYSMAAGQLGTFDLNTFTAQPAVATAGGAVYRGLMVDENARLIGVSQSGPSTIQQINPATGSQTALASTAGYSFIDFAAAERSVTLPTTPIYAVGGSNGNIYKVNPASGVVARINPAAQVSPWTISTIAYDSGTNTLYYTEAAALNSDWRLGKYNLTTNFFTTVATVSGTAYGYDAKDRPSNLAFFGGDLYYVASSTDDLVRIRVNSGATAISAITKLADLNSDTSLGEVGDLTVQAGGTLFLNGVQKLWTFNLNLFSGFQQIGGVLNSFDSITFDDYGLLYGNSAATRSRLHQINTTTGADGLVASANPALDITDFARAEPAITIPSGKQYFAVTGGNRNIFKFSALNGAVTTLTNAAPFNISTIAYDPDAQKVYYMEDTASGYRLGRSNADGTSAVDLGSMTVPPSGLSWSTSPTTHPGNLAFFAGHLFYVNPNSDSLIRIDLDPAGTKIVNQLVVAFMNSGTIYTSVGDLCVGPGGILYVSVVRTGAQRIDRFDLNTLSPMGSLPASGMYGGLAFDDATMIGARGTARFYQLSTTTGGESNGKLTLPNKTFIDFAGPEPDVAMPPASSLFAVDSASSRLYKLYPFTGQMLTVADTTVMPWTPSTVAYDPAGQVLYYTRYSTGGSNEWQLGSYYLGSGVATVLGNLGLRWDATAYAYPAPNSPGNLGFFAGSLWWIPESTDDLVRIDIDTAAGRITNQVKVRDLTNNTVTFSSIGDLTVTSAGQLLFSHSTGIGRFDLPTMNSYAAASTAAAPGLKAMSFDDGGTLYGVKDSAALERQVLQINASTYAQTLRSTAAVPLADFARGEPDVVLPSEPTVYAVAGGSGSNASIYSVNLWTGATSVAATAPWPVVGLGLDVTGNRLFYLEDAATGFRVGRYDIASATHTALGVLDAGFSSYNPAGKLPSNFAWYGGHLWYIAKDTDDLVRVDVGPSSLTGQFKARDLTNNAMSLGDVGDLAIRSDGWMYFTAVNGSSFHYCRFNMKTLDGFEYVAPAGQQPGPLAKTNSTAANQFSSLVFASSVLYGTKDTSRSQLQLLSTAAFTTTPAAPTAPAVSISDFADTSAGQSEITPTYYAVDGVNKKIYQFETTSGQTSVLTSAVPFVPGSVAYDAAGRDVYFVENTASGFKLGRYDISTQAYTDFGALAASYAYNPAAMPANLAWFSGALWYITPGTDDLVRITINGSTIQSQTKMADVTGNAQNLTVGDLTVGQDGYLYFTWPGKLGKFDLTTFATSSFSSVSTTAASVTALYNPPDGTGSFWAASAASPADIASVVSATGVMATAFTSSPVVSFTDFAGAEPNPALPGAIYAVGGGNKNIYLVDPVTGTTSIVDATSPTTGTLVTAAFDPVKSEVYYTDSSTILYRFNARTLTHTSLGDLLAVTLGTPVSSRLSTHAPVFGPPPSLAPSNLTWIDGALYYIPDRTDDLVRINVGATSILSREKVADISGNSNIDPGVLTELTLKSNGVLYASGPSSLFSYDLSTWGGYQALTSLSSSMASIVFAGGTQLYGNISPGGNLYQVSTTTGATTFQAATNPAVDVIDFAPAEPRGLIGPQSVSDSLWAISEASAGASLFEFRNYRNTSNNVTSIDYGNLVYMDGTTPFNFTKVSGSARIDALTVTRDLVLYFVRNADVTIGGQTHNHPVFKVALSNIRQGQQVVAEFVGDFNPFKVGVPSTGGADDVVSGLAVGVDQRLYLLWREGLASGAGNTTSDYLVRFNSLSVDSARDFGGATKVGQITGSGYSSANSAGLAAAPDGSLYVGDRQDGDVYQVNPSTAAILSRFSQQSGSTSEALAILPADGDMVSSYTSGPLYYQMVKVTPGTTADVSYFSYGVRFGINLIRAIGFCTNPLNTVPPTSSIYACRGGDTEIHLANLATGETALFTNGAPWPIVSLAADSDSRVLYYVQDTPVNFQLGSYSVATDTHTALGSLQNAALSYLPTVKPTSLAFYAGSLWYIAHGTDDLVRIDASASLMTGQKKVKDLTGDALVFDEVGDLAIDDDGTAWFSARTGNTAKLCSFNMQTLASFKVVRQTPGDTTDFSQALVLSPPPGTRTLYATRAGDRANLRSVDTTSGVISATATPFAPALAVADFSDVTTGSTLPSCPVYAADGSNTLYTVDTTTGVNTPLTVVPAPFTGVSAIAFDESRSLLYYLENTPAGFHLGRYDLNTEAHISLGLLQSGGLTYSPGQLPGNLGFFNDALHYVANGTDDLVRVDVDPIAGVTNAVKIRDLSNDTASWDVGDLAVFGDSSGNALVYFTTVSGRLYSFNLNDALPAILVRNFGASSYAALAMDPSGIMWAQADLSGDIRKFPRSGTPDTLSAATSPSRQFLDFGSCDLTPTPDNIRWRAYVGGDLTIGVMRSVARLMADGTLDPAFNAGTGTGSGVRALEPGGGDKVFVGGDFDTFNSLAQPALIRLNTNGQNDSGFRPAIKN